MTRTAVYHFYDADDAPLYVGMTEDINVRRRTHKAEKAWWPEVASEAVEWYDTREEAEVAEKDAIRAEMPRYNTRNAPGRKPKTIVVTSPFWEYVQQVAPNLSTHKIAKAMGGAVGPATVARWKTTTPSGDNVVAFARTFGRDPLEAMIAAGFVTRENVAEYRGGNADPTERSEDERLGELMDELRRRLNRLDHLEGRKPPTA